LRMTNFRAVCNAKIVPDGEPFTFEFESNTSDLEVGDSVLIHSGRISSTATYHGHVREMTTRRMRVSIPLKNLDARIFEGQGWIVDRFPSDITAEASHTALYDFLVAPMDDRKRTVLGELPTGGVLEFDNKAGSHLSGLRDPLALRRQPLQPQLN